MSAHMYENVCMCIYIHAGICIYLYVDKRYIYVSVYVHVYMYIHMYIHIYVYTFVSESRTWPARNGRQTGEPTTRSSWQKPSPSTGPWRASCCISAVLDSLLYVCSSMILYNMLEYSYVAFDLSGSRKLSVCFQ